MAMGLTSMKAEDVTAANVVAAMQLHAKLQGELVDRTEDVTLSLEKASDAELSFFEVHGRLPNAGELQDGPERRAVAQTRFGARVTLDRSARNEKRLRRRNRFESG